MITTISGTRAWKMWSRVLMALVRSFVTLFLRKTVFSCRKWILQTLPLETSWWKEQLRCIFNLLWSYQLRTRTGFRDSVLRLSMRLIVSDRFTGFFLGLVKEMCLDRVIPVCKCVNTVFYNIDNQIKFQAFFTSI